MIKSPLKFTKHWDHHNKINSYNPLHIDYSLLKPQVIQLNLYLTKTNFIQTSQTTLQQKNLFFISFKQNKWKVSIKFHFEAVMNFTKPIRTRYNELPNQKRELKYTSNNNSNSLNSDKHNWDISILCFDVHISINLCLLSFWLLKSVLSALKTIYQLFQSNS